METARALSTAFLERHPLDAARLLERLEARSASALLEQVGPGPAAAVLRSMASHLAAECLARMDAERSGQVAAHLPIDAAAGLLRRMSAKSRQTLLERLPTEISRAVSRVLQYPEDAAAAIMDPHVLALPLDISVGEALTRLRRAPQHVRYYVYVVDREQVLTGVITLRELMLSRSQELLGSVMHREVARVSARAKRESVIFHPSWRELHTLPVVDEKERLLGIVRFETVRRLEELAATEQEKQSLLNLALSITELYWMGLVRLLDSLDSSATGLLARESRMARNAHGS